ncbi:MAG: Ca2+-dependent phosphoinositide-specific phospholipase C [Myxococcota bacterium]|nr:Ca2+-dependent phosphoinositide-specific phospholipase C [Myxococcota bacterium]
MRVLVLAACILFMGLGTVACGQDEIPESPPYVYPLDDELRLHHVQVRGTHNSYHIEPESVVHPSHAYSHAPLDIQLETQNVRTFELDLHRFDDTFEVFHLILVDEVTSCQMFTDCLSVVQRWSASKPDHLPIMIWIEMKSGMSQEPLESLLLIEQEIETVFPAEQLLTPALVRGDYGSVREALATEGWPTLGEIRGRTMFIILNNGEHTGPYTNDFTSLENRILFPRASSSQYQMPWAAVEKLGTSSVDGISQINAGNMLVAANVCSADDEDATCYLKREEGIANGIHMLKDDYPYPVADREYWMELPDGPVASCNPLTAPPNCTGEALEWKP